MGRIQRITLSGTCNSSGVIAETLSDYPVYGRILKVNVDYSAGMAGTADLTLKSKGLTDETFLTKSNNATDFVASPRAAVQDETGADATYDGTRKVRDYFYAYGKLSMALAQGTSGETVSVEILVEDDGGH